MQLVTAYLKGRRPSQVLATLQSLAVDVVLDVRRWAIYPVYFSPHPEKLRPPLIPFKQLLAEHNIEYRYEQLLGNPSIFRKKYGDDWETMKQAYRHYVLETVSAIFDTYIALFKTLWQNKVVCLSCYCPTDDPRYCHRFWLKELFEQNLEK